MEEAAFSL